MSSESHGAERKPSQSVTDTSSVIAVLFNEPGAELVVPQLTSCIMSAFNLAEAASVAMRRGMAFLEARDLLSRLPLDIVSFDRHQAYLTASLQPLSRPHDLSYGDRVCLALAMSLGLPVLTADRVWKRLPLDVEVRLIR